jgi:hypothetical protein
MAVNKRKVNLPLLEVFIASAAIHVIGLFILGTVVLYQAIAPNDSDVTAPPLTERIDPKQLQMKVQLQEDTSRSTRMANKITVKNLEQIATPAIDLDLSNLAGSVANVGSGSYGAGFGGSSLNSGGVDLTMPEMTFMGVRTKGLRFAFILDASDRILTDDAGGIEGYNAVKDELLNQINSLPPGAVFNVIFYKRDNLQAFSTGGMVSATQDAKQRLKKWLDPINRTFATKGISPNVSSVPQVEGLKYNDIFHWTKALKLAMHQGTDSVFLITHDWGYFNAGYEEDDEAFKKRQEEWERKHGEKWREYEQRFRDWESKENAARRKKGQQPVVIPDRRSATIKRYPDSREHAPVYREQVGISIEDLVDEMALMRQKLYDDRDYSASVNVIHMVAKNAVISGEAPTDKNTPNMIRSAEAFESLARRLGGRYKVLRGYEAIEALVK